MDGDFQVKSIDINNDVLTRHKRNFATICQNLGSKSKANSNLDGVKINLKHAACIKEGRIVIIEVVRNESCADFFASKNHSVVDEVSREFDVTCSRVVNEHVVLHVVFSVG